MTTKADALREALNPAGLTGEDLTTAFLRALIQELGITREDVKGLRHHAERLAEGGGLTDAPWMTGLADRIETILEAGGDDE